jgi:dTMP kinase
LSLFVTFEGTEGSGKTSQIRLLAEALERVGHRVRVTREPGGTALGEELRRVLLESEMPLGAEAEAYLMTGARAEHVRQVIRPALVEGAIVVCDRFVDSTLAYQGAGRGLSIDELRVLQRLALGDVCPDLTILLDLPIEVGLERRGRSVEVNRIDRESTAFHERVAAWYRDEAASNPDRWVVVDATRAPHLVHTAILESVMVRLGADSGVRDGRGSR